jgi:hypothetical protein
VRARLADDGQTLFFDAVAVSAGTAGPDANHAGHREFAKGTLRDAAGRTNGTFAFICRWVRVLATGDAVEKCTGTGKTRDGRLWWAGTTRSSLKANGFRISGGTGHYTGARGYLTTWNTSSTEYLVGAEVAAPAMLSAGVVPRPPANARFIRSANRLCKRVSNQLDDLPPFPFSNFDPLHPNRAVLRQVGVFFTGPGDPRPALRALAAHLRAFGSPPTSYRAWRDVLAALRHGLAIRDAQDQAALADHTAAFVKTLDATSVAYRNLARAAIVFGTTACIF